MTTNKDILHSVWDKMDVVITTKAIFSEEILIDELLSNMLCTGPHYYYVVDFYDRQIKYMSHSVLSVLGLAPESVTFDDIINRIHPDDIDYVAKAESTVLDYLYNHIGCSRVKEFKNSYCFRMKMPDQSYQLFQHQSVILTTDQYGGFARALNIHTNISHLTKVNNYQAIVASITGEQQYVYLDVLNNEKPPARSIVLSRREKEIVCQIARGLASKEIASKLCVSIHTVNTHRRNILQKAGVKSSGELVSRCVSEGLI